MVEGEAEFVPEDVIIAALNFGHDAVQPLIEAQETLRARRGKPKMAFTPLENDEA